MNDEQNSNNQETSNLQPNVELPRQVDPVVQTVTSEPVMTSSMVNEQQEEMEILEDKPSKPKKKKSVLGGIISAIITLVLVAYIGIVLIDYFQVKNSNEPKFCYNEEVHTYSDGTTTEYHCLGYKVFKYERESLNAQEFGFFIDERGTNE